MLILLIPGYISSSLFQKSRMFGLLDYPWEAELQQQKNSTYNYLRTMQEVTKKENNAKISFWTKCLHWERIFR
jgi:hypothetical protein